MERRGSVFALDPIEGRLGVGAMRAISPEPLSDETYRYILADYTRISDDGTPGMTHPMARRIDSDLYQLEQLFPDELPADLSPFTPRHVRQMRAGFRYLFPELGVVPLDYYTDPAERDRVPLGLCNTTVRLVNTIYDLI